MTKTDRSNEKGIAMIVALFMVLAMSVLGTSLMFVSQTETTSSMNYRLMSQARYGAESGIHKAANFLLNTGYVPPGTVADPLTAYTTTVSPVTAGGAAVVLSSDPAVPSTYPVLAVRTAFAAAAAGPLDVVDGTVTYTAHAKLLSMRQIFDQYSLKNVTLQTWEISATGRIAGAHTAEVEVSAIVERQPASIYSYAAFATYNGCAALSFAGGANTDSYDSAALVGGAPPSLDNYGGNVGTNGNLTEVGNPTVIHGSMSTPRAGVGACTVNNVTAETLSGNASVSEGLTQLSQEIQFPTPDIPNPGTGSQSFAQNGGCPADVPASICAAVSSGPDKGAIISPTSGIPVLLGDVTINGSATLQLKGGTYIVNSIDIMGSSKIKVVTGTGPVIFKVKGDGVATPIKIEGNGISNPTFVPTNLEFQYAGTGNIQIAGGTDTAALFYAPNAVGSISGGADLYGSIVVKQMTATGGAAIHYDRRLARTALTAGNYMMSAFTWKNYPG